MELKRVEEKVEAFHKKIQEKRKLIWHAKSNWNSGSPFN